MNENFDNLFGTEFPTKLKRKISKDFLRNEMPYKIIIYDSMFVHGHLKSSSKEEIEKWAFKKLLNIYAETLGKYKKVAFELELKDKMEEECPKTLEEICKIMSDIYINEYEGYDEPRCEYIYSSLKFT